MWTGHVQLVGEDPDPLERIVRYRVRRVRREGGVDEGVGAELVVHLRRAREILVRPAGPHGGKVEHDHAHHAAHAGRRRRAPRVAGIEVHVVEAGRSPAQHLGDRERSSVAHEFIADPAALDRPDVLLEPAHEGQVVGDAPHERHSRVGVGVDEPRQERVLAKRHGPVRGVARACLCVR